MPKAKKKKVKNKKEKGAPYTKTTGEAAAKRNCKATGGKWVVTGGKGRCVGGVL